jgi:hypothetical protein
MMKSLARTLMVFAVTALLAACAGGKVVEESQYSGFLKDYSQLKAEKDANGQPVMRYLSPKLTSGAYSKVMIDRVEFYPAPKEDKDVTWATLYQIRDYFDMQLRKKVGEQVPVVNEAGPGVVRLRVALTAVKSETASLKAWQYIPIALVVQGAKAAAGTRAKDAELYVEMDILDSQTGQRLGAVVKSGTGTEIKEMKEGAEKGEKMVTLADVEPVLDNWAELVANFASRNLHPH